MASGFRTCKQTGPYLLGISNKARRTCVFQKEMPYSKGALKKGADLHIYRHHSGKFWNPAKDTFIAGTKVEGWFGMCPRFGRRLSSNYFFLVLNAVCFLTTFAKKDKMLFQEILNKKAQKLIPEFDRLFDDVIQKQTHDGDLLLVEINGFYDAEVNNWTLGEKMSPYLIGPDKAGHSAHLHYQFIHRYRTENLLQIPFEEYLKRFEWDPDKQEERQHHLDEEEYNLQMEMLVYLKIWEADMFIKRLYQITRLVHGESYDWHFKISESNRDKSATGNRDKIIRTMTRDRLQANYPEIYAAMKNAFRTQIRNSIAHSKYNFQSRYIHPNNYIAADPSHQLKALKFDDWIDMFHDTMLLYNEQIRFFKKVRTLYAQNAARYDNTFQIRIERKDPTEVTELEMLRYRPQFEDWHWLRNEKKS